MKISFVKITAAFWLASVSAVSFAVAADTETNFGPRAVSAPNGKIEAGLGIIDFNNLSSDELVSGGAAISIPVGDDFGFQADFSAVNSYGTTAIVGTGHAFTRDPNSYLLGAIAGAADIGSVNAKFIGPEVELYLDNISLEAIGGYMNLDSAGTPSVDRMFVVGTMGYYATENLRLTLGASSVAKFESGRLGFEWLASDLGLPAALKGDLRFGEDNFVSAEVGLAFYFGGNEQGKSLKRRHREDDPAIRSFDIFGAGAAGVINASGVNGDTLGDAAVCDGEMIRPYVYDFDLETYVYGEPVCQPMKM